MDELVNYVCGRMPVRSRVLGRRAVASVVEEAVRKWPAETMAAFDGSPDVQETVARSVGEDIAKEKKFGSFMLLWSLSVIVGLVFQWWLSRRANREKMSGWQFAMRGGS